jgi:hypothetical protein
LYTLNSVTFKHKFLAWVNIVEHHGFFFHVHNEPMWRTPKSQVEPTWGSNYVELQKVGTWGTLPTSSTKKG